MALTIQLPPKGSNGKTGLTCTSCNMEDCPSLTQGCCPECYAIANAAWQKKLAKRQDPAQFDLAKLVNLMLTDLWMHECEIIQNWMPNYPGADTVPICAVKFTGGKEEDDVVFLRYSNGALQGYFWDIYPDNMHSPEVALLAISRASPPPRVGVVVPTHGR